MSDPQYSARLTLFQKEQSYSLSGGGIVRDGGETVPFAQVREIRIYDSPGLNNMGGTTVAPGFRRCVIWQTQGRPIALSSNHFVGLGRFENRRASFDPFVEALVQRVAASNPTTIFIAGMPYGLWLFWIVVLAGAMIITPLAVLLIAVELFSQERIDAPLLIVTFLLAGVFFGFFPLLRTLRRNRPHRFDPRNYNAACL